MKSKTKASCENCIIYKLIAIAGASIFAYIAYATVFAGHGFETEPGEAYAVIGILAFGAFLGGIWSHVHGKIGFLYLALGMAGVALTLRYTVNAILLP